MKDKKRELLFTDISHTLYAQAERLLKYISKEMKGHTVKISCNDEDWSLASDFLENENLMINFGYEIDESRIDPPYLTITLYKIYPPNNFNFNLVMQPEDRLFKLIPQVLTNALRKSVEEQSELVITL